MNRSHEKNRSEADLYLKLLAIASRSEHWGVSLQMASVIEEANRPHQIAVLGHECALDALLLRGFDGLVVNAAVERSESTETCDDLVPKLAESPKNRAMSGASFEDPLPIVGGMKTIYISWRPSSVGTATYGLRATASEEAVTVSSRVVQGTLPQADLYVFVAEDSASLLSESEIWNHQGVKENERPVLVILASDNDANGWRPQPMEDLQRLFGKRLMGVYRTADFEEANSTRNGAPTLSQDVWSALLKQLSRERRLHALRQARTLAREEKRLLSRRVATAALLRHRDTTREVVPNPDADDDPMLDQIHDVDALMNDFEMLVRLEGALDRRFRILEH